ncbi:MAG: hypothetical protein PSV18_03490 [Methylobacter sp.]|nr:hypothetical protein [Candidatus Methylobacter titanis]
MFYEKIGTHTVHNKKSAHRLMGDEWMIDDFPYQKCKHYRQT